MKQISFAGLQNVLERFNKNGRYASCCDWEIANGGYDLWWEIYYKDCVVLQCVDGALQGNFRPFAEFTDEAEKTLIKKVRKIFNIK